MTFWDERYAEPGLVYGEAPNEFLVSVAHAIPPGPVLCIGEGEGRNALFLAGRPYDVEAMDASAVGMAKARDRARAAGVSLRTTVADLADFDFGEARWSGIVSIFCHLPPPLRRRVHRAVVGALAPGGHFVVEAYTPAQLERGTGGPRSAELLYDAEMLGDDLEGLDLVHVREIERDVVEGRYHTGMASVVQVVAVRPGNC